MGEKVQIEQLIAQSILLPGPEPHQRLEGLQEHPRQQQRKVLRRVRLLQDRPDGDQAPHEEDRLRLDAGGHRGGRVPTGGVFAGRQLPGQDTLQGQHQEEPVPAPGLGLHLRGLKVQGDHPVVRRQTGRIHRLQLHRGGDHGEEGWLKYASLEVFLDFFP